MTADLQHLVDERDEDLVGFYVAVLRRLGLDPLDWAAHDIGDVLAELDRRLVRPAPRPQPAPVLFGHSYLVDEAGDGSRRRAFADGGD